MTTLSPTTIKAIETATLTVVGVILGALVSNATTISPTYGAVIGALALAGLNYVNGLLGKPVVKALSMPMPKIEKHDRHAT